MNQLTRRELVATELLSSLLKNPNVSHSDGSLRDYGHRLADLAISLADTLLIKLDGTTPGQEPSEVNLG